jgi:hypothetical protein
VLGIELDDSSHRARSRVERDAFVDELFRTARLPLLHVPVRQGYDPKDLQAQVLSAIEGSAAPPPVTRATAGQNGALRDCPTCGILMILRTAQRGANRGSQFYGCANYPECRQTVAE